MVLDAADQTPERSGKSENRSKKLAAVKNFAKDLANKVSWACPGYRVQAIPDLSAYTGLSICPGL